MSPGLWNVVFSAAAAADLGLIETHLTEAYRGFGESETAAADHAAVRVEAILTQAERLATAPLRGQARDDLLPGLRHLSLDDAIYWSFAKAAVLEVRVLAIFFGGQDHQRQMLILLLQRSSE